MRNGHNGYGPSAGVPAARDAVAGEYTGRGWNISADRVFITAGTSEGIELALSAMVDPDDEVLLPMPTYPLYTASRMPRRSGGGSSCFRRDGCAAIHDSGRRRAITCMSPWCRRRWRKPRGEPASRRVSVRT